MALRMNRKVASFNVVARGLGCILVLEVRERTSGSQAAARWAVHQDMESNIAENGQTAGGSTTAGGQRADGEGVWQIAGGRKKGVGTVRYHCGGWSEDVNSCIT
jgi:hypothetical protein